MRALIILSVFASASVYSAHADRLIYADEIPGWIFAAPTELAVSANGTLAAFGRAPWFQLIDLSTGEVSEQAPTETRSAYFAGADSRPVFDTGQKWIGGEQANVDLNKIPSGSVLRWSKNGKQVAAFGASAYYVPEDDWDVLSIGEPEDLRRIKLDGRITAVEWLSDQTLAVLVHDETTGLGALNEVHVPSGRIATLAEHLDAAAHTASLGVDPNGPRVLLSLAGLGVPKIQARQAPLAPKRDLDIYAYDLSSRSLERVVDSPFDDFAPVVVGETLYWTRSEVANDVVVIPFEGGRARLLAGGGALPYWAPDASRLAYTVGDNRIVDSAMYYDAVVVDIDAQAQVLSPPRSLIDGNHEDFTPAWSPDGRWLVYHTHRCDSVVPFYLGAGCRDGIGVLRDGAPLNSERVISPHSFWEVGPADWAPDSRRIAMSSWRRGGPTYVAELVVVTIDPDTGEQTQIDWIGLPGDLDNARMQYWSPVTDEIAIEDFGLGDLRRIFVLDLKTNKTRELTRFTSSTITGLDWSPDGGSIIYSDRVNERHQLFKIPAMGGAPVQLSHELSGNLVQPQVSPDGRFIAATRVVVNRALWSRPLH